MTEHECVQCGESIGDKTACLGCTIKNINIIRKEWGWKEIRINDEEFRIVQ